MELICQYFQVFGTKECFFPDIRKYLVHIKQNAIDFVNQLKELWNVDSSPVLNKAIAEINIAKVKLFLSSSHGSEQLKEMVKSYTERYIELVQQKETTSETSENRSPLDDFLVVVACVCGQLFSRYGDWTAILDAVTVLEYGLTQSKNNFHIKLYLLQFYQLFGCFSRMQELFSSMDIKHIQWDTLSHLITCAVPSLATPEIGLQYFDAVLQYKEESRKDVLEMILQPYRNSCLSRVREFVEFGERLENSHTFAVASTERVYQSLRSATEVGEVISILSGIEHDLPASKEHLKKLQQNEDYDTFVPITFTPSDDRYSTCMSDMGTFTGTSADLYCECENKLFRRNDCALSVIDPSLLAPLATSSTATIPYPEQLMLLEQRRLLLHILGAIVTHRWDDSLSNKLAQLKEALLSSNTLVEITDSISPRQAVDSLKFWFFDAGSIVHCIVSCKESREYVEQLEARFKLLHTLLDCVGNFVKEASAKIHVKGLFDPLFFPMCSDMIGETYRWFTWCLSSWEKSLPSTRKKSSKTSPAAEAHRQDIIKLRSLLREFLSDLQKESSRLKKILQDSMKNHELSLPEDSQAQSLVDGKDGFHSQTVLKEIAHSHVQTLKGFLALMQPSQNK